MYIKQIISVHPRSSCTIFCAKCGTALLKIRPFEGFAPQLYPENPKMRYSSTQAPASPSSLASRISLRSDLPHLPPLWPPAYPSALTSRISLLSGLPHLPPPHLPHLSPPRLPRFLPPSHHLRLPPAVHRACDSAEREGNRRKNGGTSGKTENQWKNRRRTEKRKRTENRRGREEREEKRQGTGGKTEEPAGKGGEKGGETAGEGGSYQQAGMCELH